MKQKTFITCAAISALLLFSACGGNKGITPAKETISGPLGQYFKVVNRTYKINSGRVNVEFERIADGLPAPWKEGMEIGYSNNRVEPGFVVEFMDADGDIVDKDQTSIVYEDDELESLVSLAVGETASIPFDAYGKTIKQFKVSSTYKYHEPEVSSTDISSTGNSVIDDVADEYDDAMNEAQRDLEDVYDEVIEDLEDAYDEVMDELEDEMDDLFDEFEDDDTKSKSSDDWDSVLDDYEKLVDKYTALLKKANAGDLSALTEYVSYMEKAEDLADELDDAEDDMTSAQMRRYIKITEKMSKAAASVLN